MNIETGKVRVPLWLIWTIAVVLLTAVCAFWYYKVDPASTKALGCGAACKIDPLSGVIGV